MDKTELEIATRALTRPDDDIVDPYGVALAEAIGHLPMGATATALHRGERFTWGMLRAELSQAASPCPIGTTPDSGPSVISSS
jgi:hypothetical protein